MQQFSSLKAYIEEMNESVRYQVYYYLFLLSNSDQYQ